MASRQRKEAAGGALRIQLTAGRLLGKGGAGGNTGKILGIHKFHAQAGQLLEATEKGRQAAGGGQQEASGDGGDRPRSVIKEAIPGTRLGGGAGRDSREGRMEARKALFCGISGGEEQNEGGAEDGAAAEITTEGIQEEAQGETAQGHMAGDKKPGVVTEQATGERETMQAAEAAAEYHEPGVGDKEGDEEAGWERWREMRGEKEKGQRYKDQLDRAAGRSGRSGKDGYGTAQRDGSSAMEAKRSGDKDYMAGEGEISRNGGEKGRVGRAMIDQRSGAATLQRRWSSNRNMTTMETMANANGGEKGQLVRVWMEQHSRATAALRRQSSCRVEVGDMTTTEGKSNRNGGEKGQVGRTSVEHHRAAATQRRKLQRKRRTTRDCQGR